MPMIKVELLRGRSVEQKREFAEVVTREASRILKCKPEGLDIVFIDIDRENWSNNGTLAIDKS
ncbi:MAG: 4-oxalocrotonate tautomerase [Devosia sp.]|nr:4-oxalocrotonate tautomerase [Devosia sp.]